MLMSSCLFSFAMQEKDGWGIKCRSTDRLLPSQHCDSADGWSHTPVRISWRGSPPDRVCREAARAPELVGWPGRMQQEALLHAVQSGDIVMPSRHCLRCKTTWLLDSVWGIVVWNMHLFCTVLYLISYVFITQWVCGQISKMYNLMLSHIYKKKKKKSCLRWQRSNPSLQHVSPR